MKGSKPKVDNVIPMKGDGQRPVPDAPEFMSTEGREVWGRLAPVMMVKNRLEPHYEDLFAAYCEAVADFIRHTGDLAMMGSYYQTKTRNGVQEKKRAPWGSGKRRWPICNGSGPCLACRRWMSSGSRTGRRARSWMSWKRR